MHSSWVNSSQVIRARSVKVTGSISAFFHTNVQSIYSKTNVQNIQTWYNWDILQVVWFWVEGQRSTLGLGLAIWREFENYECLLVWLIFITRQHTDAWYWYSNSVRLSVCLSVRNTLVLYENGLTYRHSFFSPYGSPIILVLPASNIFTKFEWFSTNKSLYLANDTRYRHSYYGRRIGNRTQACEWHQFQWPWATSKPDFKVTILFNVK